MMQFLPMLEMSLHQQTFLNKLGGTSIRAMEYLQSLNLHAMGAGGITQSLNLHANESEATECLNYIKQLKRVAMQ